MTREDTDRPGGPIDSDARTIRILTERLERLAGDATLRGERLVDLAVENAALQREIDARYAELAKLTRLMSDKQAELAREIALRKEAEAFATAVTSSSVWRATKPLRRIIERLTGRA